MPQLKLEKHSYEASGMDPIHAWVRPNSSDGAAMKEVITRHCYTRRRSGFDVMPGEAWVDLGANVGAFTLYALARGAKIIHAFEPDPECFELLEKNVRLYVKKYPGPVRLHNYAVTNQEASTLPFKKGRGERDFYRATALTSAHLPEHPEGTLRNQHGKMVLRGLQVAGVKMDIEGSEFGLIEDKLLPNANKLVMEYHFSRQGKDLERFQRHVKLLKKTYGYKNHFYPAFIDRDLASGSKTYTGRFDCQVFFWK